MHFGAPGGTEVNRRMGAQFRRVASEQAIAALAGGTAWQCSEAASCGD